MNFSNFPPRSSQEIFSRNFGIIFASQITPKRKFSAKSEHFLKLFNGIDNTARLGGLGVGALKVLPLAVRECHDGQQNQGSKTEKGPIRASTC